MNEQIKLMQGDCLERMKEIPDGSVDMVLTDPPYDEYTSHGGIQGLTSASNWDMLAS